MTDHPVGELCGSKKKQGDDGYTPAGPYEPGRYEWVMVDELA